MAKDYQGLLVTGGMNIGMVGADESTDHKYMIAVAKSIRELMEVRKFAVQMEQVWYVEYDKTKFPGQSITKAEAKERDLKWDESSYSEDDIEDKLEL